MSAAADMSAAIAAVTCVGARVDWLTLAFRVRFSKDVLQSFVTTDEEKPPRSAPFAVRAYLARKYRVASVRLDLPGATPEEDPADFRMRMIGEGKTVLENGSCRVILHENAPRSPDDPEDEPGWTLAVEWSGVSLIATPWLEAVRQSFRIAEALGEMLAVRMRRLDLCADMAGFPIPGEEGHGWCTRPQLRSRKMRHAKQTPVSRKLRAERGATIRKLVDRYEDGEIPWSKLADELPEIDETFYYPEGNCTGWRFGKGPINARVYDKPAEMRMRLHRTSRADKRKEEGDKAFAERAWWTANGWRGQGTVVRCEIECRGEFLHEIDIAGGAAGQTARCDIHGAALAGGWRAFADRVEMALDPVWRYAVGAAEDAGRKDPLPVDDAGRCVKCKVKHASTASCRYTLAPKSGWLRQIILDPGAARSECDATAAWRAVQRVSFHRPVVQVPQRSRKRSMVRATQTLGTMNALCAANDRLPFWQMPYNVDTGEMEPMPVEHGREDEIAEAFAIPTPDEQRAGIGSRARVQQQVCDIMADTARLTSAEIADHLNHAFEEEPVQALIFALVRRNAAIARWKEFRPPMARGRPPNVANDVTESA
jgi:hypothetical protein